MTIQLRKKSKAQQSKRLQTYAQEKQNEYILLVQKTAMA